jgi:hypothetical protein
MVDESVRFMLFLSGDETDNEPFGRLSPVERPYLPNPSQPSSSLLVRSQCV